MLRTSGPVTLELIHLPQKSDDLFKKGFKYRKGTWSRLVVEGNVLPDVADLYLTRAVKASSRRGGWIVLSQGDYPLCLLKSILLKSGFVQTSEGFVGMPSERMRVLMNEKKEEETYGFIGRLGIRKKKVGVLRHLSAKEEERSIEYNHLLHSIIPTVGSDGGINWPPPPKLNFF